MTYYSCHDFSIQFSGPRGIRTLDLLNAIETRSQLRHGPIFIFEAANGFQVVHCSLPSGPEGIRTPDLVSAIDARSQLRYRPFNKATRILIEADVYVKQRIS